ncbi:hypothetical protein [Streptomyces sp. NPDC046805]|uniref:hypothetical protein n=1 Tax=Streptomyces sp. NPDC046805 TaxID=3155134 RepID=UPI0033E57B52
MSDPLGISDPLGVAMHASPRFPDGDTPQMAQLAAQLQGLLRHDGLAHLVLYDGDAAKVVLDAAHPSTGALTMSADSASHERTGRQLYYILEELAPDFTALRTGALIRTVLRVPTGAVLYYLVEPGFHLYGATAAVDRLGELDARMAECVNGLRLPARYSPLNYGSWFNDEPWVQQPATPQGTADPDKDPGAASSPDTSLPVGPYVAENRPHTASAPPPGAEEALRSALGVEGLHYVAYHESPTTAWAYDIFDHPGLGDFFRVQTPDRRRGRYGRMGQLLPGVTGRMNLSLQAILQGELLQVVLDVEQGAVYFHSLPGRRFLMGVTLDQSRVTEADQQVSRLGRDLVDG